MKKAALEGGLRNKERITSTKPTHSKQDQVAQDHTGIWTVPTSTSFLGLVELRG